ALGIVELYQNSVDAILDRLRIAAIPRRHDRGFEEARLDQRAPERFTRRGHQENVDGLHPRIDWPPKSHDLDVLGDAEFVGALHHDPVVIRTFGPGNTEQEPHDRYLGMAPAEGGDRFDKDGRPLPRDENTKIAQEAGFRRAPEFCYQP